MHKDETYYISYNVRPNPSGLLCLGTIFARSLNIEEGDEVFVSLLKDVPILTKINVAPLTAPDREILVCPIKFQVALSYTRLDIKLYYF